jgi:hypothetical protein
MLNAVFGNDEMYKFQGSWQEMCFEKTVSLSELYVANHVQ